MAFSGYLLDHILFCCEAEVVATLLEVPHHIGYPARYGLTSSGHRMQLDLGILRAGSGSGRAKKSPVFFLAARARPDPVAGP